MENGVVFDIKKYAIHDGPGIRTTVFLKGCLLHCKWCHNPEGLDVEPELTFKENRCLEDCQECLRVCEPKALSSTNEHIAVDKNLCTLCGDCEEECPAEALEIIGKKLSTEDIMREIEKDTVFYDESKGGATFSGGEPLMQPGFLHSLLVECKKKRIHTTVDTCGYAPFEVLEKIRDKVDLFLYDLKLIDDKKHRDNTGVSNNIILENLKKLSERKSTIAVRIPIIPGINDTVQNIQDTAEFLCSLYKIHTISLLPYHEMGKKKYKRLEKAFESRSIKKNSVEKIRKIQQRFEQAGFQVKIGD
jgi:pyruvate formate lyase activating enzyme